MAPSIDVARRRMRLNPRDPDFVNDPYPAYAAIREALPAFFWEDYGFWCFARFADVSALLRDRRFGRNVVQSGSPDAKPHRESFDALERCSMLELEPPEHTRLRNLVNRAFVSRRIERLGPRIQRLAHERIDALAPKRSADLVAEFAGPIPVAVIADLLGVPREMGSQLVDWSHRMVAMYQFGANRAVEERAAKAARAFADYVRGFARARRGDPDDDLVSQLLIAESDGGKLSEDELVATVILLLNAGHEATVQAIGNGAKTMLDLEVDARAAFASESATLATVEELLRLDPPLHLFARYALEEVEVAGVRLRKNEKIGLLLGAANRDPKRFPAPEVFDPTRMPSAHLSFGAGIHFCVGAPLARLELAVALPILFARLPGLRLAEPARYRDTFHFHGLGALRVEWG
jgi:unspecific monooxygenase